jgi:predicted nucleic acid-binding protein
VNGLVVDTSVWIDHFSGRRPDLAPDLNSLRVLTHEFIVGELRMGTIPRGDPNLEVLESLPRLATRVHDEVAEFVTRFRLQGSGIGWLDAHVLASAWADGAQLWTNDTSMLRAAARAGVPV